MIRATCTALLMTLMVATPAVAQVISISPIRVDGREGSDEAPITTARPVNIEECAADSLVEFQVSGIPTAMNQLVFYRGGAGEMCNTTMLRDGEGDDCELLGDLTRDIAGQTMIDIAEPASEFVNCAEEDREFAIFVMAMESPGTEDVADRWGTFELGVDRRRPPAPTEVSAGRGDTQVSITWEYPDGGETLRRFEIWIDTGMLMTTLPTDGGMVDAGDAGMLIMTFDAAGFVDAGTDAGAVDGGALDAGTGDAGPDAGTDAGASDAGASDAGVDAGTAAMDAGGADAASSGDGGTCSMTAIATDALLVGAPTGCSSTTGGARARTARPRPRGRSRSTRPRWV